MRRRYLAYGGVIAVLLVANLGRWWLHGGETGPAVAPGRLDDEAAFRLRANVPQPGEVKRNLFAPQAAGPRAGPPTRPVPAVAAPQPVAAAAVAPEAPPADASLGRIRLLGVVLREGQPQAYLALERHSLIARQGEAVFGRYVVERIGVDGVEMRELATQGRRSIPVLGR